ncbi:MAG: histidinol-phosphate transaminase [Elusimicrobia bacterium]|nr:histidinol-phosphate transaminase [Elusimicrobiota bacterium]
MDASKIIRKNCKGFEPYAAGKPVSEIKRELGLKQVIKMASNENPLGPSPKAVSAMKKALTGVLYYPDSNSYALKKAISAACKANVENIILGAGSDEIIELIAKVFFEPQDEIVMSRHAFIRYAMAAQLMGSKAVVVDMDKGLRHDLPAMARACTKKTNAVFIANPNNPTGTYNTVKEFEKFMQALPKNAYGVKPLVVLDEAYFEYASVNKDYPDGRKYISKYPNLIVMRTFSKIHALAGIRLGYAFASSGIVDFIERTRPPFNINVFAQAAGAASIADAGQVIKGRKLVKQESKYIYGELKKLNLEYVPTAGNFILVKTAPRISGKDFFKAMLAKGVIVRAMDEYELYDWARVTIGTHAQNVLMMKKFKEILKNTGEKK